MGRHLPGLGRQDADPFEDLAWNFPSEDGVALALELLRLRTAGRLRPRSSEPMEWSDLCRFSQEELPGRLDELDHGHRTSSRFDFRQAMSPPLREELSFSRRVVTGRGRRLLHAAVQWLERPALLQDEASPYGLRPGRHMRRLVERCFWRGYGMDGGFEEFGSRGLPTPAALLTSRAHRGDQRLRDWVDCLLAAVIPIGGDASVYAPDCRDGHILLRALERAEAGFPPEQLGDENAHMECLGRSRGVIDFELAGLRTLLHGMIRASIELVDNDAPTPSGQRFDVALLNRLFDRRDRNVAAHDAGRLAGPPSGSPTDLDGQRAELFHDILRVLSPEGIAAVAMPPEFGHRDGAESHTEALREVLVEEGLLRVVIELPARAGLLLILEGVDRRGDSATDSDILFIRPPARWQRISRLGALRTSDGRDPLAALVALVESDRTGNVPADGHGGGVLEPSCLWVPRKQLRQQGHELRPEALCRAGHERIGLLSRPQVAEIRKRLARLETLRSEVDQEMDALLDELARLR